MTGKALHYLSLIAILIAMLSCATAIPAPDEGKGTLVIIPLKHEIEHGRESWFKYYVQINNLETGKTERSFLIPHNRNYIAIKSLDPGDYYIGGYRWKTDQKTGELSGIYKFDSPFRVRKGVVTMTPFGFSWRKVYNNDGQQTIGFRVLRNTDGTLHNEILNEIRTDQPGAFDGWTVPEYTGRTISYQIENIIADAPEESFELSFKDKISNREISISDLKGKVVVIDFWATWCGPCVQEIPQMMKLYDEYKDRGVEFIGISLDERSSTVKQFCEDKGMTWPQYCEEGKTWNTGFSRKWGISSIPTLFILDKNGALHSRNARGRLETLIPELLAMD